MSMLSEQCDKLRARADELDWIPAHMIADDVRDAADTIWQLHDDLQRANAENTELRDSLKALMMGTNAELCTYRDEPDCKECSMHHGKDGCAMVDAMELLCIDMFGDPLGVEP